MRVAVLQIALRRRRDDGRPDRAGRRPGARAGRPRPGRAARAVGAGRVLLPRVGATRRSPSTAPIGAAMSAAARDAGVAAARRLDRRDVVRRRARTGSDGHGLWNTSLVYAPDGSLVATYRKIHRFGFGSGEPKLMDAGEEIVLVELPDGSERYRDRRRCRPVTTCGSPSSTAASSTPAPRCSSSRPPGPRRGCGTGRCSPTPARSRTSASSSPATRPAPTPAPRWAATRRSSRPTGEALAMAGAGEEVLSVEVDLACRDDLA